MFPVIWVGFFFNFAFFVWGRVTLVEQRMGGDKETLTLKMCSDCDSGGVWLLLLKFSPGHIKRLTFK
jgi:hypothetical protein